MSTGTKKITLNINNPRIAVDTIGEELFVSFSRCFIHANRLTSLTALLDLSYKRNGFDSVAARRDRTTVFDFACGTLKESVFAIDSLKRSGIKGKLKNQDTWDRLYEYGQQLRKSFWVKTMRDSIGFHVDVSHLKKGLRAVVEANATLPIAEMDSESIIDANYPIGWMLIEHGLRKGVKGKKKDATLTDQDIDDTLNLVAEGQGQFFRLITELFHQLCEDLGLQIEPIISEK